MATNAVTGFFVASVGDVICQQYIEMRTGPLLSVVPWDPWRTAEMGLIRALVVTPFIHYWYPFVERTCPGSSVSKVLGRILIDQSCGTPQVVTMVFFASSIFRFEPWSFPLRMKNHFFATWRTGLKFWPIVHSINFSVVPVSHRPLFAHFASVYWNAMLSYFTHVDDVTNKMDIPPPYVGGIKPVFAGKKKNVVVPALEPQFLRSNAAG